MQVSGDILPGADLTYNLGSTGLQWHSLFVGTGSIHVGNATIGASGTSLVISTLTVSTINSAPYMWSEIGTGTFSNAEYPISFIPPYTTNYAVQITPSAYTSSTWYAYFSTLSTFTVGGGDTAVGFQWTTSGY